MHRSYTKSVLWKWGRGGKCIVYFENKVRRNGGKLISTLHIQRFIFSSLKALDVKSYGRVGNIEFGEEVLEHQSLFT